MPSQKQMRALLALGPRCVSERRPSKSKGGRRVFVGDIQGCRDELETLLDEVHFKPGRDRLLPVGDLVNRGPRSLGTLRLLKRLDARPVLGNHDLHALDSACGRRALSPSDTLDKLLAAPDAPELLAWLASQPLVRVHKDLYQVHAGLHPAWKTPSKLRAALKPQRGAAAQAATAFASRARFCDAAGQLPSKRIKRDSDGNPTSSRWKPWYKFYDHRGHDHRYVVYGHWAVMGIVDRAASIGLDSGCVWGGALTAYIPEERAIISVRAERAYAGNFRPR